MTEYTPPHRSQKIGVVFGGSGLVGGTIVNFYKQRHPGLAEILAPSSKKVSLANCCDIRDYLMRVRPDFVINAAITTINAGSQLTFEINYVGAINIARAAAALHIPYIFFSSSATLPMGENLVEEDRLPLTANLSNYAKSKLMAEQTLAYMHRHEGLDYSCLRLAIVYGRHDHKIQGFHRMLFSIADQSMPFLFTTRGIAHSYSNVRKIPWLIQHMLENRHEFSGKTLHFVDPRPVELAHLILFIRDRLGLSRPKKIFVPYTMARSGKNCAGTILRLLTRLGMKATLPPELMFLGALYRPQILSRARLASSSFVDPFPEETVYSRMPVLLSYYLDRWSQQNLITSFADQATFNDLIKHDFTHNPQALLDSIHGDATAPFADLAAPVDLSQRKPGT
ncbi:NAD-dependent epimerase/dehydratase family protein [Desulfofustis limnaeus]|uniref:NAD-dependent epimerase/dehydratase family protein n=1 Tax=Desulfofustis limnaeus TaxID=2740163 RepID=UPI0024E03821|nr:NAD(P)-dependent oxidoreductase [Desulfofustis limnaeus]MDX9894540.1 NAD(P)-dependent oxidoreductase [Desulfofustis sp.]